MAVFTLIPCTLIGLAYWAQLPSVPGSSAKQSASPVEVAQELHRLHLAGDYRSIGRLLAPEKRESTLELLRSIDEALAATRWLQDTSERRYAGPIVEARALAEMEDRLGVFSTHVAVLGQTLRGDTATLTLQQGTQIPLVYAHFKWTGREWLYLPDDTPAAVASEMRSLAAVLRETASSVEAGATIDAFAQAFVDRVGPQMRKVATAAEDRSHLAAAPTRE